MSYKITYQLLDIEYFNGFKLKSTITKSYTHRYHDIRNYVSGGDMFEWRYAKKLMIVYKNRDILFLYLHIPINEIDKAMKDTKLSVDKTMDDMYMRSRYMSKEIKATKYAVDNKVFDVVEALATFIRTNIVMKDIAIIANSDTHGDIAFFLLPYLITKTIKNVSLCGNVVTYYTAVNNIIHINNGDYYCDVNHIHDRSIRSFIDEAYCKPSNQIIQLLMFAILSDGVNYRLQAYFVMGNHDKHSFLSRIAVYYDYQTILNNRMTTNVYGLKQYEIDKEPGIFTSIDGFVVRDDFVPIEGDKIINNMCIKVYVEIDYQLFLFQHSLFTPATSRTTDSASVIKSRLIHKDVIARNISVYLYKFDKSLLDYTHIYETEFDITGKIHGADLKVLQDQLVDEIYGMLVKTKPQIEITVPIVVLGHNKNFEYLKLHSHHKLNNKGVFSEQHIQGNPQSPVEDDLMERIIMNDEYEDDYIFVDVFGIDMYYNSSLVAFLKFIDKENRILLKSGISISQRKIDIESRYSYPIYYQSMKGGSISKISYMIYIIFIVLIILITIYLVKNVASVDSEEKWKVLYT